MREMGDQEELFAETDERVFIEARGAAGQLGLRLQKIEPKTKSYFQRYRQEAIDAGVPEMSVEQAIGAIERAVRRAIGRTWVHAVWRMRVSGWGGFQPARLRRFSRLTEGAARPGRFTAVCLATAMLAGARPVR